MSLRIKILRFTCILSLMSLMREIKRRNVHRVALGYLAFAWLLVQIADTLLPIFDLSNGVARALVVVLDAAQTRAADLQNADELIAENACALPLCSASQLT